MKRKLYRISVAVALVVATFTSCNEEFLELDPPTSLAPADALKSAADLQVALRGVYQSLRAVDYFGRTVPMIGDIMADNAFQHATNTNRYTQFNNYTAVSTDANALGLWNGAYTAILRANNIINSTVASTPAVDQYKGEAYALRALSYFTLVRYFAKPYAETSSEVGVPIVLSYNPDLYPARNTIAEVYTQILNDLGQAFTLMTLFTNSSQFSKYAARGLEAKVHLTMGNKASALAAATDVITNGGFTSLTAANHAAYWTNAVVRTDKLETLFEVSSDAVGNNAFDALSYLYSQRGNYGDFLITSDLLALFPAGDVRLGLYPTNPAVQPVPPLTGTFRPNVTWVNKYPSFSGDYSDTKVLRMSEMYLIAAEASLPADETGALTYLNFIRGRRGIANIASTGAQLFEDVITERRMELAFEGDRLMDLQRLKRDITRSPQYVIVTAVPYTNFRRLLPIPQAELDANANIRQQQNEGYQ